MGKNLAADLRILEEMVTQLPAYMGSEVMFWNLYAAGMPMLTLGGCFMRQHRLSALADLLDGDEKMRLQTAVTSLAEKIASKTVRVEQKATEEIFIRARQFGAYLKELQEEDGDTRTGYGTAVESRLIIEILVDKLGKRPYQLDSSIPNRINSLDTLLKMRWQPDDFIWPSAWTKAYPPDQFWWLYGQPYR